MDYYFNHFIDVLMVASYRLFELPVSFLMCGYLLFLACTVSCYMLFLKKKIAGHFFYSTPFILIFIVLPMMLIQDIQLYHLKKNILHIESDIKRIDPDTESAIDNHSPEASVMESLEIQEIQEKLKEKLGVFQFYKEKPHEAVQVYFMRKPPGNPIAMYMAVIDLEYPSLNIQITPELGDKQMTSDFGRKNKCIVAINGEAGESPARLAEFGEWKGNWISDGHIVMLEDTNLRPFLSFDPRNKPTYYRADIVDRELDDRKFNTLFGRFDLILNGEIVHNEHDQTFGQLYPRTAMGINHTGTRLFLLVVDGRTANSIGMTAKDTGRVMLAFGAYQAMLCDQGGSACMYMQNRDSIVNIPSDGEERPVYSHFGISIRE